MIKLATKLLNKYRYHRAKNDIVYFMRKVLKFKVPDYMADRFKILDIYHPNEYSVHKLCTRTENKIQLYDAVCYYDYIKKHDMLKDVIIREFK
jgi:hypothetical protein